MSPLGWIFLVMLFCAAFFIVDYLTDDDQL